MLAELSIETSIQPNAVRGSLETETGSNDGVKSYNGFVTAVLSPLFIVKGVWRVSSESNR